MTLRHGDLERGRLWSRHPSHLCRVEAARAVVRQVLSDYAPAYVSFSAGKDSAALLDLVLEVDPTVEARMVRWPETKWIDDYDRVLAAWESRGARVNVLDLSRGSLSESVPDRWVRLRHVSPARASFVGLRADESSARRLTLAVHGVVHVARDGFVRACPLARWATNDVAARIVTRDLPTLSSYGEEGGIDRRTTARVPRAAFGIRDGFLADLRARDPQAYDQVRAIYSEIS